MPTRLSVLKAVVVRTNCTLDAAHFLVRTESGYYPISSPSARPDPRHVEIAKQVEEEMGWTHEPVYPANEAEREAFARAWLFIGS